MVEVVFIMVLHVVVVVRGLAAAVGVHHWGCWGEKFYAGKLD